MNMGDTKRVLTNTIKCLALGYAMLFASSTGIAAGNDVEPDTAPAVVSPAAASQNASAGQGGKFLALSDVHLGLADAQNPNASGQWGCRHNCETDMALWKAAQEAAVHLIRKEKPEFVIYTGDLPAHNQLPSDRGRQFGEVLNGLQNIVANTNIPVIYLPGNNDSIEGDYCAFTSPRAPGTAAVDPFVFSASGQNWPVVNGRNKIEDQTGLKFGYYSIYPPGKPSAGVTGSLRVIALNTTMFTRDYEYCVGKTAQQTRVNNQLDWLENQLSDARNKKEKVLVAMHVPPGFDGYSGSYMWDKNLSYTGTSPVLGAYTSNWAQHVFVSLTAAYNQEIVGMLTAHTHLNGIRRLYACEQGPSMTDQVAELAISVPGITTDHGNNPAIKIFTYRSDYELIEDQTYYAERSTKDWSGSKSFSFAENYPCTNCKSNDTLLQRILNIGDGDVITRDMLQYLKAHRSGSGPHHYRKALDIECKWPTPLAQQ